MPQEERQPRPARGFINPEMLIVYGVFMLVAAVLLPILERLRWHWAAIPLAVVSLVLGGSAALEAAQFQGRAVGVLFAIFVLAVTAFGVVRLAI